MGMNHRPNSGKAEKISEIIGFLRILRDQLFVSKATKPSIPIDLLALLPIFSAKPNKNYLFYNWQIAHLCCECICSILVNLYLLFLISF